MLYCLGANQPLTAINNKTFLSFSFFLTSASPTTKRDRIDIYIHIHIYSVFSLTVDRIHVLPLLIAL